MRKVVFIGEISMTGSNTTRYSVGFVSGLTVNVLHENGRDRILDARPARYINEDAQPTSLANVPIAVRNWIAMHATSDDAERARIINAEGEYAPAIAG